MNKQLTVIGGGAAGMMAAICAARRGTAVTLLEPNERLGKKLNITGKGRCNVTNDAGCEELLANVPQNGRFLYSAFSRFDGRGTMAFFEELGVPLKVERGRRVFPVSDRAFDVSAALERELRRLRVTLVRDRAVCVLTDETGAVRGVNWRFNAWGGEVDGLYAHWEKDDAFAGGLLDTLGFRGYNAAPFVMEGGAVHSDGEGTLLVTEACLLSAGRNPQLTKDEIAAALCRMLGAKKILWLPRGIDGDETNEHVDNVCAFVRPGEVVLAWTDDPTDPQYACSQACLRYLEGETDAQGRRIRVHKLPIPRVPVLVTQEDLEGYTFEDGEDVREVGERLAASYVNYYCANGAIVLPAFGGENAASDAQAAAILAGLFPERRIISVYAREILTGGGNIHCITQQIPEGAKL